MTTRASAPQLIVQRGGNQFKVGIIGHPNVGKSCLFNILSENRKGNKNKTSTALVDNSLFTTIDPNVVTITLPDERLEYLRGLFEDSRSKAEIEGAVGGGTRVTLVDSRGIIKGDYTRAVSDGSRRGSSRGGDRLAPVDVLVHLLRGFEDKDLTHVEETVDPIRDHHTVHSEIMAKDLLRIERTLEALRPAMEMQTGGTDAAFEFQTLERAWETLTGETVKDPLEQHIPTQLGVKAVVPLSTNVYDRCKGEDIYLGKWSAAEKDVLAKYQFLTGKACVIVLNVSRWDYLRGEGCSIWHTRVQALADRQRCALVTLSLDFECHRTADIAAIRLRGEVGEEERLLSANPTHQSASIPLMYECLQSLQLLQVYTALPSKEETARFLASGIVSPEGERLQVNTWMVPDGAGGSLEDLCNLTQGVMASRSMRRADVVAYDHILEYDGDIFKARLDGQVHSHNKSYILIDGDVIMAMAIG